MDYIVIGTSVLIALLLGAGIGYAVFRSASRNRPQTQSLASVPSSAEVKAAEDRAREILDSARRDAEQTHREAELRAKDDAFRRREELNRELEAARVEVREQERRLEKREDAIDQKQKTLARKERQLEHVQKKLVERREILDTKGQKLDAALEQQTKVLLDLSGYTREQAQQMLLDRLQNELSDEIASRLRKHEELLKATAEARSREILTTAIQRYAAIHTANNTVSTVDIPSDDMKGRIIGREGRNIRTFEKCTGVDVIVDDTPGVVIVSAFDNIRRETARIALTKLIADGRIHPTRIEEVVAETQTEMEAHIMELGKQAVIDVDIPMPHEKIVQLLGRLKFRTSYSQNVLQHSTEVAHLCGLMATELGLNATLARRCGLLHDVGKAADHEMEGGHPKVGAELARRYGETSPEVLHAIIGHHDDVTPEHLYTVLVAAADAISASRPGARRETLERYVKRLEELEAVACGFPGVEQAYAIQAGRELRVIANSSLMSDSDATRICREIARAIEQQLNYPGEIKVTVIRETRAMEVAK